MVCSRLGLSKGQFHALVTSQSIVASQRDAYSNTALYSEETVQELLNRQADGSLFRKSPHAQTKLEAAQVVIAPYTPEDSVRIFEHLKAGMPLHEIVIATRLDPLVVKHVTQKYDEMSGAVTVPRSIVEQMNRCTRLPGRFPLRNATDILELLKSCELDRECPVCQNAPSADRCVGCLKGALGIGPPPAAEPRGGERGSAGSSGSQASPREPTSTATRRRPAIDPDKGHGAADGFRGSDFP